MSRIFEALTEAQKEKQKKEAPPISQPEKVVPPQREQSSPLSPVATEQYMRLHQRIMGLLPDLKPRVLMFVSPNETTDSSTVVLNFSSTLAGLGESVVIVDADRHNPMLHKLLYTNRAPGITELVSGKAKAQEVMHETIIGNLLLVPAGAQVTDAFSANEIAVLFKSLNLFNGDTDWIIVNSPFASRTNDTETICGMVDGVVLVIRAEKTRWEDAQTAKERLEKARANILGAILTHRKYHLPDWLCHRL